MKLIIDIPNEGYDWIKNGFPDNEDKEFLIKAVKNGAPYDEKPQGEWIYLDKDDYMKVECPFCHERKCCISNYCDNCGADMRKGGTE